jgi:MinD-like ATPase involved in chromosome partitioning or flagellar assembly
VTAVPLLTAGSGAAWEATLVSHLEHEPSVRVVRRCVDVPDLVATAASGQARAVLLSADLRRLDRDTVARLHLAGLAVLGVVPADDDEAGRRLVALGVARIVAADAPAGDVSAAVLDELAVRAGTAPVTGGFGSPATALPVLPDAALPDSEGMPAAGTGRLVAVWGPTGAPGRTTLAVNLAAEAAAAGRTTLLVDADTYGGVVAQVLGLLDEAPGLAAATRSASTGRLDLTTLAGHARQVSPHLRVLTGVARADRWTELRVSALEVVLALCRSLAAVTVVDCGFCLEQDEELSFDTAAPRRNGATLAVLAAADTVVAVGAADPVGLQRLVRALPELRDAAPAAELCVVVNRVRASAAGPEPERQIRLALHRYAGVADLVVVPDDAAALDAALLQGRALVDAAPSSPARQALRHLAAHVAGLPPAPPVRRWWRRRLAEPA